MIKKLIHIAFILIITALGALQFLDHHSVLGVEELSLSSCDNEEHSHQSYNGVHICLLLRKQQTDAYLNSEKFAYSIDAVGRLVYVETLIFDDIFSIALFEERAPPLSFTLISTQT